MVNVQSTYVTLNLKNNHGRIVVDYFVWFDVLEWVGSWFNVLGKVKGTVQEREEKQKEPKK